MSRSWAIVVNLVLCLSALAPAVPAVVHRSWDSFPLSFYPMFSESRRETETVRYVQVRGPGHPPEKVPFGYWTSGGFNQGSMQLRAADRRGKEALDQICEQIAERWARKREPGPRLRVEIVKGEVNPKEYFVDGKKRVRSRQLLAQCPVAR